MDETKTIRIVVDASKAIDGGRAAQRALEDIERNTGTLSRAFTGLESTMRGLFSGYLGMQGIRAVVDLADKFTAFTNSLKVAGVEAGNLTGVQDRLFAAANKHGIEIGAVGQLYSRLAMSSKELGASQGDMLKFVDGVTAALRIQGGSTESASGALLQLAQAMGAGVVRAEEFNSILEGALPIAQAAARGIDGIGGSVAKLRAEIASGNVTSQRFFEGALRGFKETEATADKTGKTMSAAITGANNSLTRFIGTLDQTVGASRSASAGIDTISAAIGRFTVLTTNSTTAYRALITLAAAPIPTISGLLKTPDATRDVVAQVEKNRLEEIDRLTQRRDELAKRYAADPRIGPIQKNIDELKALSQAASQARENAADLQRVLEDGLPARDGPKPPPATTTGAGGGGGTKAEVDEVGELIKKIEADAQKLRESFEEGTAALAEQNGVLELELKLMGEAPEIRARELAILRTTNEAKKAGWDLESDAYKARLAAVEQGERLRIQQDEIKRSQELWTEPLKQALRDIQSIGADAFDKLLENGKFSFEELGQTFMRIIRRMAAEFLALATIRPVMSVLVNAVSPSMAQQMGLGGGSGGGMFGGGSGGFNMPSLGGGGGSGLFGNIGGFLNSPIMPQSIDAQIANWSTYGTAAQNSMSGGFLANTSWMQGIGALAGAGMGIYQLASGNGSASSTIGGISSIVGAGLSLIPGIGPFLGAGVSLLGNMLPGLLGMDKPPTITNQTYGQLTYGADGWYTTGGAWGPSANSGDTERGLKSLGGGISSVFDLLGGVKDPTKVWGLSAQNKTVSGQGWSSSSDSTYLVDPNGNQQLWRMNEGNMMDTGSAQVAYRSILEGAVGTISENMRKAVTQTGQTMGGTSLQAIAETVAEVLAFDTAISDLGKTMVDAEQAVLAIDQSFAGMYATAEKYGLATGDLDAAKASARLGVATDFGKSISRGILEFTDPKAAALQDIEDWRAMMVDNNKWLLDNVAGALDQINEIEKLYGLKRAAIVEQTTSNALGGLKSTIDRLLYGDLSGASPGDVLSGTKGTYMADLAQAFTGDAAAAGRLNSSSADYMQAAASYYGTSSAAYQALRKQTIIDVSSAYRYNGGQFSDIPGGYDVIMGGGGFTGLPGMGAANLNIGLATVSQQFVGLSEQFSQVLDSNATRDQKIDELLDLLRRYVVGLAA
jgi:tape measure domain-containing protein